jgi:hypothetical protein
VYEHLPVTTITQVCKIDLTIEVYCRCDCDYLFLTTTKLQYALLATSKLIREEARSYLDSAFAKTQPVYLHSPGLNDGTGHGHGFIFQEVLGNLVSPALCQDYTLEGLARARFFTKADLTKALDLCAFTKQHHRATGRNLQVEVHCHNLTLQNIDRYRKIIFGKFGVTVDWLNTLPVALRLSLTEAEEV